jgi:DNA end-binding protein Ku
VVDLVALLQQSIGKKPAKGRAANDDGEEEAAPAPKARKAPAKAAAKPKAKPAAAAKPAAKGAPRRKAA